MLGALHVASWREAYTGLLPDHLLDGLSAEARSAMWATVLNDPARFGGTEIFVAVRNGDILGFGASGGQREEALKGQGFDGEFGAIYVLKSHQRAGVGTALMNLMARNLLSQGRRGASLWVLRQNLPARTFYERLGGTIVGERDDEQSGVTLSEVAYGWSELSSLTR